MSSRRELANAIRALSMDAVQKANSGHPGAPMALLFSAPLHPSVIHPLGKPTSRQAPRTQRVLDTFVN